MDLLTIVGALFSRWFVVVPVLALTAYGAVLAADAAEIEYTAEGSVLVVSPAGPEEGSEDAAAGSQMDMSGAIIAELVQSDEVRIALSEQGAGAPYGVEAEQDGSILRVTSLAEAPEGVVETVSAVLQEIVRTVERRQADAGIPVEQHIAVELLVEPVEPTPQTVRDEATGDLVPRWSASGVALFVDPVPAPSNPLEASRYLVNVLEHEMADGQLEQTLLESEGVLDYNVSDDRNNAAPILYLSVTGTEPGAVMRTYDRLIEILETRLADSQEALGAPDDTWITLRPLSTPIEPEADASGAMRPALTIVALGVFAAVSLAVLVDGLLSGRRRRRSRRVAKPQEPQWVSNGAGSRKTAADVHASTGRVITLPEPPGREDALSPGRRYARRRHRADA